MTKPAEETEAEAAALESDAEEDEGGVGGGGGGERREPRFPPESIPLSIALQVGSHFPYQKNDVFQFLSSILPSSSSSS